MRRLQRMDVEVYRLTAPLAVPDFKPYGRAGGRDGSAGGHLLDPDGADAEALDPIDAEREHLRAVPVLLRRQRLEQPAAVQPQRGPLGCRADARRRARGAARRSPAPPLPAQPPRVGVYQISGGTSARESTGWLRYLLEQVWHLPYQPVTSAQIAAGSAGGLRRAARPERSVDDRRRTRSGRRAGRRSSTG